MRPAADPVTSVAHAGGNSGKRAGVDQTGGFWSRWRRRQEMTEQAADGQTGSEQTEGGPADTGQADTGQASGRRATLVAAAQEQWASALTDLGGRNTLLYYKDRRAGTLDL